MHVQCTPAIQATLPVLAAIWKEPSVAPASPTRQSHRATRYAFSVARGTKRPTLDTQESHSWLLFIGTWLSTLALGTQQSRAWLSAIGAWVFSGQAWVFWIGDRLFLGGATLSSVPIRDDRIDRRHSRARKRDLRLRRSAFSIYTRGVGGGWRARYPAAPAKRAGFPDITSKEWT
jgi:hypothetical protein